MRDIESRMRRLEDKTVETDIIIKIHSSMIIGTPESEKKFETLYDDNGLPTDWVTFRLKENGL